MIFGSKNITNYYELFDYQDRNAATFVFNWLKEGSELIVFFKDKPVMNSIAHESVHLANNIIDFIGHRWTNDNDEIIAYLVGHLVDVILKAKERYEK